MKKRLIRKQNKQRIKGIIESLDFKAYDVEFYESYSLATGTFKLREFNDWKFGIWLNYKNKSFDIFGENIYMIDKFKPSRCTLSFESTDIEYFQNELKLILENTDPEWNEYLEKVENAKILEDISWNENFKIHESVKSAINELNTIYDIKDNVEIRITDYNTRYSRSYPRYRIGLYAIDEVLKDNDLYNKYLLDIYNKLSDAKLWTAEIRFGLDDYQFENISLYSPEEYEYNKNIYSSWTETFEEYKNNLIK